MLKARFYLLAFVFLIALPLAILAQPKSMGRPSDLEQGEEEGKHSHEDEIKESKIGLWYLNGDGSFQDSTKLDTLHDYTHIYHPVFKNTGSATYTGNYGMPGITNDFFKRRQHTSYLFLQSRQDYLLTPDKVTYLNTTTPYTRFDYSQSENKSKNNETRFNVIHSQNINPFWNFTFRTNQEKSDGQYNNQETRNNFVSVTTSYNRDNWNVHGGVISNSIKNNENGGLVSDSLIFNGQDPAYWSVNLTESSSKFGNVYYYGTTEYRLGKYELPENDSIEVFRPIMGLIYSFEHERNSHEFIEEEDEDNEFWENTYYPDSVYTKDEIKYNKIHNIVQLKQYENPGIKYSFGKRAFLGHELYRGSMPGTQQNDSVHYRTKIKYSNLYVGGGIFRETGRFWTWNFDGRIFLTGRKSGQVELNGIISKPFKLRKDSTASITFTGSIVNRIPDYFEENFSTKHFKWTQGLDPEQRINLGASLKIPKRKFEIGANYAIINNFIYNNYEAIPDQTSTEMLVMSVYADKDFNYRNLHFRTRLLWQEVSEIKYLHLPRLSAFVNTYYQFTISKVMLAQIGGDVRYSTKYWADAYEPSTGLFYLQDKQEYGDFPYIDIYANLRLKRTRVFFKWVNIGTNFLDGVYMTTPNYPMPRATFRLGVSWAWYD